MDFEGFSPVGILYSVSDGQDCHRRTEGGELQIRNSVKEEIRSTWSFVQRQVCMDIEATSASHSLSKLSYGLKLG